MDAAQAVHEKFLAALASGRLPDRADARGYGEMSMARLDALGVRLGGMDHLRAALRQMAEQDGILPAGA